MLSRDCDGCSQFRACSKRYRRVTKGDRVYCLNGTAHLVDEDSLFQCEDLYLKNIEMFQ
jgi:hypothetical protein